ncbi:O-antigen ligase family protein [Rhizobium sp. VS19-DR104.2]|uniref:O-antigen ligase family protein n=1 Tax=unclassified Rhizobium TaxID=2613769 RepID=UPI001CC6BDD1|nr:MULTISPECIES: O-antigen ligase family protein [unclassified Rhizobium]MBZ5763444.1 O-antigen ligase family protein [Rhizobium sp. VS19-DR96]MBZ5769339.1 O-antigen ligase family protein [Rhizobium sp. VS19-DR129.2]MBZ5776909.1 O-antigen ligase family protein [Rhizobium sp. VS19-DRK62.2]MBZ5788002.1 O-antigen ligase family protein [Rhizobium sp. VS19-DR121]MBZ5805488.1 O-antigen ligase family protein [Rhizobium sp. VS19-DR181]
MQVAETAGLVATEGILLNRNSPSLFSAKRSSYPSSSKVIEIGFFLFLLLVMVRIGTGEADSAESRIASLQATESGDVVKQLLYTLVFGFSLSYWLAKRGLNAPLSISVVQFALMGWILASSSWAFVPGVSFRRAVLLIFVFTTIGISVDIIGPVRSIRALYNALVVCLMLSLAAVFFVPSVGLHPMTELDSSIAGGWRGIFVHKNTAGGVIAMAAILFLHFGVNERKFKHWLFFALSMFFIVFSKSKTPLALLLLVVPLGFYYRIAWKNSLSMAVLGTLMASSVAVLLVAAAAYSRELVGVFSDPEAFTGRVAIWKAALSFAADHFWLGSGYSSLWNVSSPPPIYPYISTPFLQFITHSHNGYIEIFATTGIVGLLLAVVGAVVVPLYQLLKNVNPQNTSYYSLLFSLWLYGVLENMTETQLYTRDREIWVIYFIAILILQNLSRKPLEPRAEQRGMSRQRIYAS